MLTPDELPELTDEILQNLLRRYSDPPLCRVCNAPLKMAEAGPRGVKMVCSSDAASATKSGYPNPGWKEQLRHWDESAVWDPQRGDPWVVRLIEEVRACRQSHPDAKEITTKGDTS